MSKIVYAAVLFVLVCCGYPLSALGQSVPVIEPEPLPEPPAEVSDWYLRGDIAYVINEEPGVIYNETVSRQRFGYADLDDTGLIGVGLGRRVGDVLRTDLTADVSFETGLKGGTVGPCSPATCATVERADMWAVTLMANAYLDLGHYAGFSPYIGGGVGLSYMNWDYNGGLGKFSDRDVRFTWAAMAGLSYDVNANWTVDAGYRFLHTPDGNLVGNRAALNGPIRFDDLKAHAIRIGMRYALGGPSD